MKDTLAKFKQHPKYDSILKWTKLISITGSAQIIVQGVGFACGILIIRMLPIHEYAFYTLANTMLGTISVLADSGISLGVMTTGSRVWQDKEKLGIVMATGLDLRKKFAVGSLLISIPILLYLLRHNGASWIMALLISVSMIPAFFSTLSDSLLGIVPKLHQNLLPLQKNQVSVSIIRLLLSTLTLFLFPWAFMVILASGLSRIWGNIQLRGIVYGSADKNQKADPLIREEILTLVKRQMPESIYYCLSGQITIWIISFFGTTASLANLGALSRFAVLTGFLLILLKMLVIPRFARLPSINLILFNKVIYMLFAILAISGILILFSYSFSNQILSLLGKQYSKLNDEFVLIMVGSCITLIQGFFFSINSCKGWIINPILYILSSITITVLAAVSMNFTSLINFIIFNIIISIAQTLMLMYYCFYRISKL